MGEGMGVSVGAGVLVDVGVRLEVGEAGMCVKDGEGVTLSNVSANGVLTGLGL